MHATACYNVPLSGENQKANQQRRRPQRLTGSVYHSLHRAAAHSCFADLPACEVSDSWQREFGSRLREPRPLTARASNCAALLAQLPCGAQRIPSTRRFGCKDEGC